MTKRSIATSVSSAGIAALAVFLAIPTAFGADIIKTAVPFQFHVGSKTLPAGTYEFDIDRSADNVSIINAKKGQDAMAVILARIVPLPHSVQTDAHVVFDKIGSTYTLSELWQRGEEGIVVNVADGKHERQVLYVR